MVETALRVSGNTLHVTILEKTLALGKELLEKQIEILYGVEKVLQSLKGYYRLVVATKGDLPDQERKLKKSGLEHYFHHIEIMSDKQESDYLKLIKHLEIQPAEFLMIGNSIKSDVMPVLGIGGHAVHIPYHTTWAHEQVDIQMDHANFRQFHNILEILPSLLA